MRVIRMLTVCATIFVAAFAPAFAADPVNVSGRVVDLRTGKPVVGVNVWIVDSGGFHYQSVTSDDGRFHAIGLASGIVSVHAEKEGLDPALTSCNIPAGGSGRFDMEIHGSMTMIFRDRSTCSIEPDTSDRYIIR